MTIWEQRAMLHTLERIECIVKGRVQSVYRQKQTTANTKSSKYIKHVSSEAFISFTGHLYSHGEISFRKQTKARDLHLVLDFGPHNSLYHIKTYLES